MPNSFKLKSIYYRSSPNNPAPFFYIGLLLSLAWALLSLVCVLYFYYKGFIISEVNQIFFQRTMVLLIFIQALAHIPIIIGIFSFKRWAFFLYLITMVGLLLVALAWEYLIFKYADFHAFLLIAFPLLGLVMEAPLLAYLLIPKYRIFFYLKKKENDPVPDKLD